MTEPIRIAIVGAGYIATWHAEAVAATPGLRLTAVVDTAPELAAGLARAHGAAPFASLAEMIAARAADAALILTPPGSHAALARDCLEGGVHVLVEKPVALSPADLSMLAALAAGRGLQLAAGHNFLGLPAWGRLRRLVAAGRLGRLSALRVDWALPLAPLRSGPFGLWFLRDPANLLHELGPHAFGFAADLLGPLTLRHLALSHPVDLPGGAGTRHQGWRILAEGGGVDVTLHLSMVETAEERTVTLRGSGGIARVDFGADTLVVRRENAADLILNPALAELSVAAQHLREGLRNAAVQAGSLNRLQPYGRSFRALHAAFAQAIRTGQADPRFGPDAAAVVTQAIADTLALMPPAPVASPAVVTAPPRPDVMVIGGTGYIGRALTRALVARGRSVRVLSRGGHGPFADIADRVETVPVPLSDETGLTAAMAGMAQVFNLARSLDKTWDGALENDVAAAMRVGRTAQAAGVPRLIYTGTIASYDMSDPSRTIDEDTPFGPMEARNLYARSKAECEARLLTLMSAGDTGLTIARPGIVVGGDGPLQHWGIGRWHGAGVVRMWGNGRNTLPFVLIDDVAEGLVRMGEVAAAAGTSFNLVGDPMLSARDYFDAIHQRTGARIRAVPGSLTAMWVADAAKWALKRHALRKADAPRAGRADWLSRGHLARLSNMRARTVLGWQPEGDRDRFLDRAIDPVRLFGL